MAIRKRILDCTRSDFARMTANELRYSILAAEGRTILAQAAANHPPVIDQMTNIELDAGFGADLIMINNYNFKHPEKNIGLSGFSLREMRALIGRPIGIYFECPADAESTAYDRPDRMTDPSARIASPENLEAAVEGGADFIVLGGNPGRGTTLETVIRSTKLAREVVGDQSMIWAGKWEDGVVEKVIGDPLAEYDARDVVRRLIDAGADVVNLAAPGARHGITMEMIRSLAEVVHRHKPGTLVMSFLDSSVEGADEGTIREIALLMKQTGADIHAIGDAGYSGLALPENVYQLSLSIRGRRFTFRRMAANNR